MSRIKALVDEFPDLADPLNAIRTRFVDFERIIKKHVYHPAFAGSFFPQEGRSSACN